MTSNEEVVIQSSILSPTSHHPSATFIAHLMPNHYERYLLIIFQTLPIAKSFHRHGLYLTKATHRGCYLDLLSIGRFHTSK